MNQTASATRGIIIWLLIVCAFILLMVAIGGITRLTGSGLSMVDWRPIMGVLPPLSETEWLKVFNMYQQYPEYIDRNQGMSLDDFKTIFYWEYGHRLLGRLLGLIFLIPFLYFWIRKQLDSSLVKKLGFAFVLGGLQGLMGWYMVMSGLVDEPRVSQYRLAAHLGLALTLLAYLFWIVLDLRQKTRSAQAQALDQRFLRKLVLFTTALLVLQVLFGALTAGLHAGWGYNTFPMMNGQWVASAVGELSPLWLSLFESAATVQFSHRVLGSLLLLVAFILWLNVFIKPMTVSQKTSLHLLFVTLILQYWIGVYILVNVIPLVGASLHQIVACLVLLAAVNANFQFRKLASDMHIRENG